MDIRLTAYIIPLLGHDDVTEDARTELRWLVPRITGQLTDALLDPDLPVRVRQRLPGVLEASHNPRAIQGLLLGMADESFNVRYSSARALARMRARNTNIKFPRRQVYAAIRKELNVSRSAWDGRDAQLTLEEDDTGSGSSSQHVNRGLEHVFTLLSLILDRDAVHMSMQALFSTDANLRGTALEYLENVLPADIYTSLLLHLDAKDEGLKGARSLSDIVSELKLLLHVHNR